MNKTVKIILSVVILIIIIGVISWWAGKRNTPDISKKINVSEFILFQSGDIPLNFHYPPKLKVTEETVPDTSGWSYESVKNGMLIVQLKLKPSLQPKTNLEEATFTVGRTGDSSMIKKCMQKPEGFMLHADSLKKDGRIYFRTKYRGAGAGNYYTVVQYRTIRGNYCYSIEEMVHTTNIHNYPSERGISRFDSTKVWGVLNSVWQSFRFTK